jgi:zinc protease
MIQLWGDDHRLVLVTGNARLEGTPVRPEDQIRKVFDESAAVAVAAPRDGGGVSFPYLPEPERSGRVVERIEHPDIGVTQVRFANGVTLNLKPTDFKADEVQASLVFGYGKSVEPIEHPGLAEVAPEVVTESGLGRMTRSELDRALAGTQTRVVFNVSENHFQFRGSAVSQELELLLQLLYAHVSDPAFRAESMDLVRERMLQRIESLRRTTDGALLLEGRRFLAGGDTRFGLPGAGAVRGLTVSDVRRWLEPELRHARLELSLVGDFELEAAIHLASRYFGSLPEREDAKAPDPDRQPLFPAGGRLRVALDTRIPSALAVVAYPTDDIWDISRTRRLNILADVFSDRLRVRVRESLGASYSPFAFNRPARAYPGYGVFAAMVEADPRQLDTVEEAIRSIAADLHQNGVTPEELDRALEPTLTGIKDLVETNGYWLETVLSGVTRHPEQLEWCRTIRSDYADITAEQVTEIARRYLDNEAAGVFQAAPEGAVAP